MNDYGSPIAKFVDRYGDERVIHKTKNGLAVRRTDLTPGRMLGGPVGILVGQKVRAMRVARGLSQFDLALRCGMFDCGKQRIHSIECPPTTRSKGVLLSTLFVLAYALSCSVSDLLPSIEEAMEAAGIEENHSPVTIATIRSDGKRVVKTQPVKHLTANKRSSRK